MATTKPRRMYDQFYHKEKQYVENYNEYYDDMEGSSAAVPIAMGFLLIAGKFGWFGLDEDLNGGKYYFLFLVIISLFACIYAHFVPRIDPQVVEDMYPIVDSKLELEKEDKSISFVQRSYKLIDQRDFM